MKNQTVAIIEDEADLREVLEINLAAEGYRLLSYSDGEEGLAGVRCALPDLLLLDLMLPGADGREICRSLKMDKATSHIPIIMVTARSKESDIILGLGLGADDYISKPFHIGELLARVQTALRRGASPAAPEKSEQISYGPLTLDRRQFALFIDGRDAKLTATEFRLLEHLMSSPGSVFSRELLIDVAIGEDVYVNQRTVDTHLGAVRRKLGPHRGVIGTVWGVGYRFEPPAGEGSGNEA